MHPYRRLLRSLVPHRATLLASNCLSPLIVGLQAVSVWLGAVFIERLVSGSAPAIDVVRRFELATLMDTIARGVLEQPTPFRSLVSAVAALLAATVLVALLRVWKLTVLNGLTQQVLHRLRCEMFAHLARLDLSFSRTYPPGAVASLFTRDVEQLRWGIIDAGDRIVLSLLRLVLVVALMASLSLPLACLVLGLLVATSLLVHQAGARTEWHAQRSTEKAAALHSHLVEYLGTVLLARCFGRERDEVRRYAAASADLAATEVRMGRIAVVTPQVVNGLFFVAGTAVVLVGGYQVLVSGTMKGGDLLKMSMLVPLATAPMESLALLYLSLRASTASARRVFSFLDTPIVGEDRPGARAIVAFRDSLRFDRVRCEAGGRVILDDVSFEVRRGERVAVTGPSGAGKTTLLSLIAGLSLPTGGAVLVDGVDLRDLAADSWRRRLGVVGQEAVLLNATIRENLRYARPDADDATLLRVLDEALLGETVRRMPLGLDSPVGNRGEFLSGGERQRLSLARALLADPDLLLLDEPTAMLDVENARGVTAAIRSAARERTVILVSHDEELWGLTSRRLEVDECRVRAVEARR